MREQITSRQNQIVRYARGVRDGKERDLIFIEGLRLCEEAARVADLNLIDAIFTSRTERDARGQSLLDQLAQRGARLIYVTDEVFDSFADTKNPQGVALIAERPATDFENFQRLLKNKSNQTPLVVALHQINNPSNAGGILRTSEAAGATGIITTAHTADVLAAKALRGAMGASFRLPLWTNASLAEIKNWCRANNLHTVLLDANAPTDYTKIDWTIARLIFVGAEARGFGDAEINNAELHIADDRIFIPMHAAVESLNVSVALGVVLYEAHRQRRGL